MSTLFEPVGPHSPRVYWRRRLVVVGVLVVLLVLLLRACGDDGSDPAADDGDRAAATTSAKATDKSSPRATKKSTTSAAAPRTCSDDDVEVSARPVKESYGTGSTVGIRFVVSAKDGVTCRRDVGAGANEVRVLDGDEVVWSSDHCGPSDEKDVRTLGPDASYSVLVEWSGDVTPSDCPDDRLPAPAGEYQVVGRNADVVGPAAPLTLG